MQLQVEEKQGSLPESEDEHGPQNLLTLNAIIEVHVKFLSLAYEAFLRLSRWPPLAMSTMD